MDNTHKKCSEYWRLIEEHLNNGGDVTSNYYRTLRQKFNALCDRRRFGIYAGANPVMFAMKRRSTKRRSTKKRLQ